MRSRLVRQWLLNQGNHNWKEFGVKAALKEKGIYDPDKVEIMALMVPKPEGPTKMTVEGIQKLKGNPETGKLIATACATCHRIEGQGVDYAPDLTGWAKTQTTDVVIRSIIDPSADIAHGFDGHEIVTKNGRFMD